MQKKITLKDFKVFLLKTFLPILILSISFQVSLAQEGTLTKPASARKGQPTERPAVNKLPEQKPGVNAQGIEKKQFKMVESFQPTDVPEINKALQEKKPYVATLNTPSPSPAGMTDVCVFNGGLVTGDLTLTNGRPLRSGVSATCAVPTTCGGAFGTGPYFYDTYTMQNLTCASQCVTVNYIANAGGGDVFVSAFNGSFNPANLCTNRIADGGSSSLSGGASVTFSFNLAANATVVFVVNEAVIGTQCPSYSMTVTGINCVPPPPCVSPTASVLSQVQIPTGTLNLINESFNAAALPAGWSQLNLSSPIGTGLFSDWFQGTTGGAFAANSAPDFRGASFLCGSGTATLSNWLFAPNVTLKNGDKFSFYTRSINGAFPDRMQVRLSTNGTSTNVGASATSVGDFTTLLADINPTYTATGYPTAWAQYTLTISGMPAAGVSGRIAFRYFVENGGPGGANSNTIGIDDIIYSTTTFGFPVTCTGSTANLKVDITGGNAPAYNVTINAAPGGNFTVNNYTSGSNIPVTPAASTTYTLVSVIQSDNPCCIGTGNTGTVTITPSASTTQPLLITAAPNTTLCAGNPTLLTVTGAPSTGVSTTASGPISVAIPDANAAGVSTTLNVAGIPVTANATGVGVLFNITHTWDGDLTIFLKSPNNQVLNLVNGRGGSADNFVNTNITSTAVTPIATGVAPFTGTFAPDGSLTALPPTGYAPTATTFTPLYATNGTWGLGVRDNAGGDVGIITNWTLTINYAIPAGPLPGGYTYLWTPAAGLSNTNQFQVGASPMTTTTYTVMGTAPGGCQTTASYTVNINQLPAVTAQPVNTTVCAGSTATFTAVGTGAGAAFQWQVSTNGGTTWTNVSGAPYSGVTTGTLTINPTSSAMNGYRYRMVVTGTCPPAANSTGAILTINDLPVIAISPASPVCGGVAGINGTQLTAGSSAPPVPGTATFSSGTISVPIPDNSLAGATHVIPVSIPANATITDITVALNMTHTWDGDMVFALKAANGKILNLDYYLSTTGGTGGTTGFVNTRISSAGTAALSSGSNPYTAIFKADGIVGTGPFGPSGPTGFNADVNTFTALYPSPNGNWTIAMYDGGGGDLGTLTSWSIKVDYTTPGGTGSPLTYTWSPAAGLYTNATATVPYVAGAQAGSVYAAPAVNTVYTITGTNGTTGCANTGTIAVVYTPAAPTVNPAAPSMCLGDVAIPLSIISSLAPSPFTTTYSSGVISVPVIDNTPAGSTSTINVPLPGTAQITNMVVAINITHTWAGDMAIVLKAPNNNILNLDYFISGTGGTGATAGFTNTRFSSSATAALSSGANPYNGIFKADAQTTPLGGFGATGPTGMTANTALWSGLYSKPDGNWTLGVYDGFGGDAGTLTSWSLTFDYLYGPPAPGIWTPNGAGSGLYLDAAALTQYNGTSVNTVYAKPGASTTYSVTVSSVGFDATQTLSNPASITINDNAPGSPYPSNITVSGLPASGAKVKSVVLSGINHTWSDDIDILLQSPTGTNVTLMSDVGGANILSNATYTFDDAGPAMSAAGVNASGTYRPTNNGASDNYAAPVGAVTDATPALANFTGNFNGVWKLYVMDDVGGDLGNISGGYNITFVYPTAGCASAARTVPVTVNIPVTITSQPVNAAVCTDKVTSFTVVATGTTPTYQWQVSTDVGNTFTNISNGGVYAGATSATLTITAPPVSMTNYYYRCVVKGASPCGSVNSLQRVLTVNPLPTVVISASLYKKLFPGLRTTISSTVSPAAALTGGYTWLRNGIVLTNATTSSVVVDIDGLGDYTLKVKDVNGCENTSNLVSITDSVSGKVFIYPNPNSGQFQVRYHSVINNTGLPRGINIYDARGKRIATKTYSIGAPYGRMDVDLRNHGTGVYWIEVVDVVGNRLAMGRAEVLR